MRPTVVQLEYLVAVARHLNFRKAAASIHATQPALSAQIQKLETTLGAQLFERDRRKVLLTPVGERMVEAANDILQRLDDLAALAVQPGDSLTGPLRLGSIPTVAPFLLPSIYKRLGTNHPDIELVARENQTRDLLEQLRYAELDLLLLAIDVDLGKVDTLHLFDDPFFAALPEGHALAKREQVSVEDFANERVLLLAEGHCLSDQTRAVCRMAGIPVGGDFRASSLSTLMYLVAADQGLTMVPGIALRDAEATKGMVVRPFAEPAPSRRIGLAWRCESPRADAYRALGDLFAACRD